LFEADIVSYDVPGVILKGAVPAQTGVDEPDGKSDISKMSYSELAEYYSN
jgi:hypothetical protein